MMGVKRLIQQQQLAFKEKELLSEKADKPDADDDDSKSQDVTTGAILSHDSEIARAGYKDTVEKPDCEDKDVQLEPEISAAGTESVIKETDSVTSEKESDKTELELVTTLTGLGSAETGNKGSTENRDT